MQIYLLLLISPNKDIHPKYLVNWSFFVHFILITFYTAYREQSDLYKTETYVFIYRNGTTVNCTYIVTAVKKMCP